MFGLLAFEEACRARSQNVEVNQPNQEGSLGGRVVEPQQGDSRISAQMGQIASYVPGEVAVQNNVREVVPVNSESAVVPFHKESEICVLSSSEKKGALPKIAPRVEDLKNVARESKASHGFGETCSIYRAIKAQVKKHKKHGLGSKCNKRDKIIGKVARKFKIEKGTADYTKIAEVIKEIKKKHK